ncbi:MAG: hypothetical protein NVS3B26_29860 [Mycobacteriales bacterium]
MRTMTSPTGQRPRHLFFYAAVVFFIGLMYFLYQRELVAAIVSGALAVACVFVGTRSQGGT